VRNGKSLKAEEIVKRIKRSDFSFESDSWLNVSSDARDLVKGITRFDAIPSRYFLSAGLLVVNPQNRLKIDDVIDHKWVKGGGDSHRPLLSPKLLTSGSLIPSAFSATLRAYHHLTSANSFHLSEVNNAPLAKRRNRKRQLDESSSDDCASSSGSSDSQTLESPTKKFC